MTNIDDELRQYYKFLWADIYPQESQKELLIAAVSNRLKRKNRKRPKSSHFLKTLVYKS